MADNKILFKVEGDSDEVKFLRRMFETCYKNKKYSVYTYRTNIHILSQELYNNYPDFDKDDIDIKLVLKSLETDKKKRALLDETYNDIYLIFDFDPHHDHPHFDTVQKMLKYFNDSTNQGKLYINYPMMQSYKHFRSLPDYDFKDYQVTQEEIIHYKQLVGDISCINDITKYTAITFYSIAVHHLKKVNYINNSRYLLPTIDEYFNIDSSDTYAIECKLFTNQKISDVLNTSIFSLIEFAPTKFFTFVSRQQIKLHI